MDRYINKIIRLLVRSNLFWSLIRPVVVFFQRFDIQRKVVEQQPVQQLIIRKVLQQPVVRHGLFKGLKYPSFEAAGSAVFPKFIGSYESELLPVMETIQSRGYELVLDIGCAEGYYANGLAMILPDAKVYAYDTDERARMLCGNIARLNQLEQRVMLGSTMDANSLAAFDFAGKRTLIISDCEGYEKALFTPENVTHLTSCDILIEVHDLFDLTISETLRKVFAGTHDIRVISSVDDVKKAQTYHYPETDVLDLPLRKAIFAEGRQAAMEWFFCTPKIV